MKIRDYIRCFIYITYYGIKYNIKKVVKWKEIV